MATISQTARRQINALKADYRDKNRPEAIRNLRQALIAAEAAVDHPATRHRNFPATYRSLARPGVRWLLVHMYWISYKPTKAGMAITNVFWDQADIPTRQKQDQDRQASQPNGSTTAQIRAIWRKTPALTG
jgi:hypothetical protein